MTRYPNNNPANKGKPWTIKALDAITREWKGDTLSDGSGLFGEVRENSDGKIKIAFKYGFKLDGKKVWHYCGIYPDKSLADIRKARDEAKSVIAHGLDPRVKKVTDKILEREKQQEIITRENKRQSENLTIKDMFDHWVANGVKRSDGNKFIYLTFNKYIIPVLGRTKVSELSEDHLNQIYKNLVADGKFATALELSKDVKQMLSWAEKRKPWRALLMDGNPAFLVEINNILPAGYTKVRDRVLSYDEIRKLKDIFENTSSNYLKADKKYEAARPLKREVQLAMWICLSTVCRIGELLMGEWAHVDFDSRNWFIPAANTKGVEKKKTDHNIYLSDFAIYQFRQLYELTGHSKWLFPARYKDGHVCVKSASKQIGDRQVKFKSRTKSHSCRVENDSLVLGEKEWTPHDLRRTGSTMMQNLLGKGTGLLISDLCLHHIVITGSAKHYFFDDYADDMKNAWIKLGEKIEQILEDKI